jgi:phosphopantetheinyl transferase (holo-ACP synthase)
VSVGNDVVDLADPETRLEGLHARWGERVFCAAERAALEASPARHRLQWALWASKESAYKALKRRDPGAVFSPSEFVVELSPLPPAEGVAVGRVVRRGEAFPLEVRIDEACVHAVATSPDRGGAWILSNVDRTPGEPSLAVRRLAAAGLGSALGLAPERLRIAGRPPMILHHGRQLAVSLSLSHHGRFVAFACAPATA